MEMIGYALGVLLFIVIGAITFTIIDRTTPAPIPPDYDCMWVCNEYAKVCIRATHAYYPQLNKRGKVKKYAWEKRYFVGGATIDCTQSTAKEFMTLEEAKKYATEWVAANGTNAIGGIITE